MVYRRSLRPLPLLVLAAMLAAMVAAIPVSAGGLIVELNATLTGDQEVPPSGATATGAATVTIDTAAASGSQLCYDLVVSGLTGAATAAHIHEGAVGTAPPSNVVVTLTVDATGSGMACAADADFNLVNAGDPDIATLLADIANNPQDYYVNVHTEANPAGEIRGQLDVAGAPTGMVMVMKHLCDASIQSEADFMAVEARAASNPTTPMGVPSLGATAETVLACPVIVETGDTQTPGAVGAGSAAFDFTVTDSTTATQTLTVDSTFSGDNGFTTPVEDFACESNIKYDADRDGSIEASVCLDFSNYAFDGVVEGETTVVETAAPAGARFGTVRLTPPELSDDAVIGLGFTSDGTITFDSSLDEDAMVMLHVYNFQNAAATASPSTTATPAASQLPDSASPAAGGTPAAILWLAGVIALLGLGSLATLTVVIRRRD